MLTPKRVEERQAPGLEDALPRIVKLHQMEFPSCGLLDIIAEVSLRLRRRPLPSVKLSLTSQSTLTPEVPL